MDPRFPYLPHTRYANRPSPPPPPPFANSPGFHHANNLFAPPPPQLRPHTPPPPPQQFHHQNLQFSYNSNSISPNNHTIHDNYHQHHQRSQPDPSQFSQLSRVSHQFDDDRQLPRLLPEFDHHVHDNRPNFRVANDDWQIRHEFEGNSISRFIEDRNIVVDSVSDNYHRRSQFVLSSDRSPGDFRMLSSQSNSISRGFESNSGNYENWRGPSYAYHDGGRENQRWVNDRDVTRDARDSFIQIESNEIVDGETRVVTGKREHYRSREGNFDLERHGGKRSREGSYEFNRTPRKPVQKKSALLRIQKPSFRNREDERKHYSGYFEDTKSSFYRGKDQESGFVRGRDKDQELFTDRGMGEEPRELSPVELDVSFKSNSLVAKAIVTPSSCYVGAPETKLTPRNSKVRKVLVPDEVNDKNGSVSSMNKLNKVAAGLDNSSCCETKASSSKKDLKKSKEGGTAAIISNVRDSGSLPGKTKVETRTKNSVLVESRTNIVSGRTSSVKGGKKKTVVKKTLKKRADPNSRLSSSYPTKTCHAPVRGDSFAHNVTSSIESDKAAAATDVVDSQSCPNESDKVERLTKVSESGVVGAGADSGKLCGPHINGRRSYFMSPSVSSTHEETKFDESLVKGDCPDTDSRLVTSLDETIRSDIGGVEDESKQLWQNGDSSSLENNAIRGSPNVLHPIEHNGDLGLLSSEKMVTYEGPANTCMATMGLDIALTRSQDIVTVSDMGSSDAGCKELCTNEASENGILDEFPNASVPVASSEKFLDNQGVGVISDSRIANSEEINFSGHGTGDDISKPPSQDGFTKPFENVYVGGSLNNMVSTSGSREDLRDLSENDKKIAMTEAVFSSSNVFSMHLEPANAITSTTAHWVDTTLRLCFEDNNTAQSTVSGSGFLDAGSQPCSDVVGALSQGSLTNLLDAKASVSGSVNAGPTGASPLNERKRKSSASQLELYSPLECVVEERRAVTSISTSGVETPTNPGSVLTKPEEEVLGCNKDPLCTSALLPARKALPETCSEGEHFSIVASVKDAFEDDGLKGVHSHPAFEEVAVLKVPSPCAVELGDQHITDATRIVVERSKQKDDSIDIGIGKGEKMDVDSTEEQVDVSIGTAQCQIPSKLHSLELDKKMSCTDVKNDSYHGVKNDLSCMSNDLSSFGDDNGVSTANSSDELMEFEPDTLSDTGAPEPLPDALGKSLGQNSVEKIHGEDDKIPLKNPAIEAGSTSSTCMSPSQSAEIISRSDRTMEVDHLLTGKTGPLPLQDSKITAYMQTAMSREKYRKKNQTSHAVSKVYPSRSSFVFTGSKITGSSTHVSKTRTWHRNDNSSSSALAANKTFSNVVAAQRQYHKKFDMLQGPSYIRKGNSLVRKPTVVAAQSQISHGLSSLVYQLNSSGTNESKKSAGSDCRTDATDPANVVRTIGANASFERPSIPPLSTVSKILNCTTNSSSDRVSSQLAEHLHAQTAEIASAQEKSMESNDVPKTSDAALKLSESSTIQNGVINNLEFQHDLNVGKLVSANAKSIAYVKRKLNQVVATSNPCASAVHNASNMSFSSDGYYKRRRNQLIRTSMENEVKQTASLPDESLNSDGETALNSTSSRSFSKRRLCKVVTKSCKPSKFSLVWTLHGAHLSKNDGSSLQYRKVLPHLFPWKRTTYWRSFLPSSSSNSDYSSLSTIGRKMLLLRKRDTVYTRSKHGFSLRKSKVLSVGGSSLKWSKSIERHSKEANEQATLAVAAADRKKRDQQDAAHSTAGTKTKNGSSRKLLHGERIFRIGSVRYKMDSSRRTLQRISDDESSCSAVLKKEKDAKKSYVPRRLVIGKDEYVRIGNGNQLIRDPKRRTRILASEKVRWSLHTARSRLARRRKYCQFFTRFGKCNKDGGKCPFIHDSSKIAVCTKFLNGLCSNPSCKLTHKVIPERMPDCSYFLQGLCTNKNCPYRHVRVNPNASTCEGFLRGYCADGNECRKKHSYVCPVYEATGSCPQGSDCKLHHPKNRSKEKKSKRSRVKKNVLGRYFGLLQINVNEPRSTLPEKRSVLDSDVICSEGSIADYISLDVSDDEVGETKNPANERIMFSGGDHVDLQLGDLDELIKPVRIMDKQRQNNLPSLAAQV